ncbi:MAG: carbon-nitrogen hydrolase family protein [Desulfobacterales bacterium]|nr:carbon-nitrogen hydrolase family protein [Desulfobacterales bacterium]
MGDSYLKYKVAAVHAAPVFLDREKSVEKAIGLIEEAAAKDAELIAFPEAYLPGYPLWSVANRPNEIHSLFARLYANSLTIHGKEMKALQRAARKAGIFVSMGFNEKSELTPGTIWASNVLISDNGEILNRHQKMVPTYAEKLVWSYGDSTGLRVSDTRLGRIGALICGENTNTLARFALLAQGEMLHISTYPPAWPYKKPGAKGEYDPLKANQIRGGAHAFEGKVYNIVTCNFCDELTMDTCSLDEEAREVISKTPKPASMIFGPTGAIIAGPTEMGKEDLLIAEIDMEQCILEKPAHDITGGYNRFDVFKLSVTRSPLQSVQFIDSSGGWERGEEDNEDSEEEEEARSEGITSDEAE